MNGIDPNMVRAGDTVTVRFIATGDEITTTAYQPTDIASGHVYILGWPLNKPGNLHGLALKHFEILDHQPAPEPEWKPGTVAFVIQGGDPGAGVDDHEFPAALQTDGTWVGLAGEAATAAPTSVRPLVVIDPAGVDWGALQGKISQKIPGERPFAVALGIIGLFAETLGIEVSA
jgi:hypothetical protein